MAKKVKITLKKEGSEDIVVTCPRKVKLSVGGALLAVRFGLPPAEIKPVQGKDVLKCWLLFLAIFAACLFFYFSIALGVIALGIVLVLNVSYNKNYFFNFIKKRLAEGYEVADEEQKKLLEAAGVFNVAENPQNQTKAKGSIFAKLNALINKLPFSGFAAKIPVLQRFAKFANYAVCILAVLLLAGIFTSKSPTDAFIDNMEHIANSMTKTVDKCEAGDITYEEMQEKMLDLVAEVDEVGEKYKGKFKDIDLTTEQKRRLLKIMNDIEKLQERGDRLLLQNYYY